MLPIWLLPMLLIFGGSQLPMRLCAVNSIKTVSNNNDDGEIMMINPTIHRIVIIGAGASGIAAGTKLYENGFTNITILEAENRLGGRVHTIPFSSGIVDMGAQWCHGEKFNVVYDLAKDYQLLEPERFQYDDFNVVNSTGNDVPHNITHRLQSLLETILNDHKEEMKYYKGSLGSFVLEHYNRSLKTPEYADIDPIIGQQFIDFFQKMENSIEGSDSWFDTSCATFNEYWECEGAHILHWKGKGYRTVFDLLMKKHLNKSEFIPIEKKIQFGKEVAKIHWTTNVGTDTIGTQPASQKIECIDGTIYEADHIICTVSLGVLKERQLAMFEPNLSAEKQRAIEGLGFGTVDKIYVKFTQPFWPSDWSGFGIVWTETDLAAVRRRHNNWLQDVFGFFPVTENPNILCGWISGVNARRMEITSDNELRTDVMFLLRKFLQKWTIPEPDEIKISKWYSNKHFRGSYSFRSIESDLLNTSAQALAAPIVNVLNRPIVQFAGEATSEHYYSTVHGAIESGWREALRLVQFYKIKSRL